MHYLPLDQKQYIQTSYVRFCELAKELPPAEKRVSIGQWAIFGGGALFLGSLVTGAGIGFGTLGLLSMLFGWVHVSDQKPKYQGLVSERDDILERMDQIGVTFAETVGLVEVRLKDSQARVLPLLDESYR